MNKDEVAKLVIPGEVYTSRYLQRITKECKELRIICTDKTGGIDYSIFDDDAEFKVENVDFDLNYIKVVGIHD